MDDLRSSDTSSGRKKGPPSGDGLIISLFDRALTAGDRPRTGRYRGRAAGQRSALLRNHAVV